MSYIPNTDDDRRRMLAKIGVGKIDDLLRPIPENLQMKSSLDLPKPLPEMELMREIERISGDNRSGLTIFAGGGVYDHFIPAAVETITGRPEFVTAYTPYQAEVAQGTLQVIYEFQSHICRLTGMDAANASMYDGASAAAEAASLSLGKTRRSKIVISDTVNPLFRDVIRTYLSGRDIDIVIIPYRDGETDFNRLEDAVDDNTACVILAQPNFFGIIEDIEIGAEIIHKVGGYFVTVVDPIAAAVLKTPADCGADIAVGEGQPLGIPLNFGGPLLGFFAVKQELVRFMPGRLVARTEDEDGHPGFVLTLQTREQHIRREKATSNICTNQALCATMATVYMSLMGKQGLKQVALLSMEKAHRAAEQLFGLRSFEPYFKGDFVREFVVRTPVPAKELIEKVIDKKAILPGVNLGRFYPDMDYALLIALTEKRTDREIEALGAALGEFSTDAVLSKM
ncbi:MAG: aminomethyl-transferring glycine dehydrogenase [candidate division Zixibacteria bacterium HGW-Zixibacteria-1]|nr:MAG: aminomethyl-transferring glycine dehydrogenase [candidate division Zixibacteria bacterium HGW-Zixibacteria-1]